MPARFAPTMLLSTLLIAYAAFAQTPSAGSDTATTTAAPSPAAAQPSIPLDTRARADADARTCLEFLSNVGVIRCAEKYRVHGRTERRSK